jgi:hypothetical protein
MKVEKIDSYLSNPRIGTCFAWMLPRLSFTPSEQTHMRTTLSLIKADIGSIGGHVVPSHHLIQTVRAYVDEARCDHLISDFHVLTAGDA